MALYCSCGTCLAKAQWDGSLTDCVSLIAKQKSEKTSNEEKKADAQALKDMHSQGKMPLLLRRLVSLWRKQYHQNGLDGFIVDILDEAVGKQDETDGKCILHPNDLSNFLKLCATICLLIKNTITDQEVSSTDTLLQELHGTYTGIQFNCPFSNTFDKFTLSNKCLMDYWDTRHPLRNEAPLWVFAVLSNDLNEAHGKMPMGKFLMFSTLTKIFTIKDSRCTLFACNGSDDGTMKRKLFGKCCVCLWELKEYINMDMLLPPLIDPTWIQNHIALKTVSVGPNHERSDFASMITMHPTIPLQKGITCTAENIFIKIHLVIPAQFTFPCFYVSWIIVLNGWLALP
ncbi:hypothetical protein EDC04DRAFT_2618428 [Pisolithus marmoratus]|nr:hypothetical protein EDC04DRAFT_2618428 [Pisolithus marmoratus]